MTKQTRHWRRSRRGKVFPAGRRIKHSQLLRNKIGQQLKTEGPYRERIIGIMEKDPLLYREYLDAKSPTIEVKEIYDKYGQYKRKIPFIRPAKIIIQKQAFKHPDKASFSPIVGESIIASPRAILAHELQHTQDKSQQYEKYPGERAALWRSRYDVRKSNKRPEKDIQKYFERNIK